MWSVTLVALMLTGCTTAPAVVHATQSGLPEATIDAPLEEVRAAIINNYIGAWTMTRETPSMVTVETQVQNVMMAALLGSRMNPYPNQRLTFTMTQSPNGTRVVANHAIVTNPGTGFESQTAMNNGLDSQNVQRVLNRLKTNLEQPPQAVVSPLQSQVGPPPPPVPSPALSE